MITTDRLILRRLVAEDWRGMQRIWADFQRSPYAKYDRPNPLDDASLQERVVRMAARQGEDHRFYAVCLEETLIGFVAMNRRTCGYELGYCFHSAYQGHGYARESIAALIDSMQREGVEQFEAGTALDNLPSVYLLKALGFHQQGTERVSFYQDPSGRAIFFDGGTFVWKAKNT